MPSRADQAGEPLGESTWISSLELIEHCVNFLQKTPLLVEVLFGSKNHEGLRDLEAILQRFLCQLVKIFKNYQIRGKSQNVSQIINYSQCKLSQGGDFTCVR